MPAWSNHPVRESTSIRAVHINELRWVVQDLIAALNPQAPRITWTDDPVTPSTNIQAVHMTELRDNVAVLWRQHQFGDLPVWTEPLPAVGEKVHASAVNDLRRWVNQCSPPSLIGAMWTSVATTRNWMSKDGWDVELVYASKKSPYDLDTIGGRVEQAHANGRNVLLRVDFDFGQTIPVDEAGANIYFDFLEELAADTKARFTRPKVFGYILGNEPNVSSENSNTSPFDPNWYAHVLCGTGDQSRNAISTIRTANPGMNVIVGAVAPYSKEWQPTNPTAWLDYLDQVCQNIDAAQAVPDGFAVHAYGRTGTSGTDNGGTLEPQTDVPDAAGPQYGFRAYRDFQNVINRHFPGTPIFITETNTRNTTPSYQSYPSGWYLNALAEIQGQTGQQTYEGQIQSLCWFVDESFANWEEESLQVGRGNCAAANSDFNQALAT
jgi:hypothetical protein